MAKRDKREVAICSNLKQVRFTDLNTLLHSYDFEVRQARSGTSHYVYTHEDYPGELTVPLPHGGNTQVLVVYVKRALAAIDSIIEARRNRAEALQ